MQKVYDRTHWITTTAQIKVKKGRLESTGAG